MARVYTTLAVAALMVTAGYQSTPAAAAKKAQADKPATSSESSETTSAQSEAKQKQVDPAEAQKALDAAEKSLESGKHDHAIQQLNALLSGSRLQPRMMARALYLRGTAHRKQGKPAQAIADLTSALWLKGGLTDADRTAALAARSEAYREAGLVDLAEADARKAGKSSSTAAVASTTPDRPAATSAPAGSNVAKEAVAKPSVASEQKSSSSGGGFFANLFGGQSAATGTTGSAKAEGGSKSDPQGTSQPRQVSVGEAWSSTTSATRTSKRDTETAPVKEEPALKPAAAKEGAKPEGRYRLQVASVRSRKEAQAVAARLKKDKQALIGAREPEVAETVLGNMGTFYRVRIGPFADATEPQALCPQLRGLGLDCLVVTD